MIRDVAVNKSIKSAFSKKLQIKVVKLNRCFYYIRGSLNGGNMLMLNVWYFFL